MRLAAIEYEDTLYVSNNRGKKWNVDETNINSYVKKKDGKDLWNILQVFQMDINEVEHLQDFGLDPDLEPLS